MKEMNDGKNQKQRPPIVVIVGHVDHGKTTLIDFIRKTSITEREAGGITQAIGAYEVEHRTADTKHIRRITFIDTPGHEAFAAMRSRGAEIADLAILLVAADEGVKPQTKEALQTILTSQTPFIVAINKIDKTSGNIERAKSDLASAGVLLEGYGGQVSFHGISAKTGEGVPELFDLILLSTDVQNLSFDPAAPASGFVIEVRHDPRRGSETTLVIKNGTLKKDDPIYTSTAKGKVRVLENCLGEQTTALEPSAPALVVGFEKLPEVGEIFSTENIFSGDTAKIGFAKPAQASVAKKDESVLNLLLKAADAGSLEALAHVIKNIKTQTKKLNVLAETVGDITDGDLKDAIATGSLIIGFKNKVERAAKIHAAAQNVTVITSDVVYDLKKAVEDFFVSSLGPANIGELEVLAVFNQERQDKQLVGGRVTQGIVKNKTLFDVVQKTPGGETRKIKTEGRVLSLRDKKTEIAQAEAGKEIGLLINFPGAIGVGDRLIIRK